jgi:DNA-directed RNA polymerase alpha subunit
MPRNNRNWSAEEEKRLLDLIESGAPRAVIAKTLQRTEAAIEGRAHTLRSRANHALSSPVNDDEAGSNRTWSNDQEMSEFEPTPELPDETLIDRVRLPTRIRNVLDAAGLKTVGEVRETSDETLLGFQDFGEGPVTFLRNTLGLPSCDGIRPAKRS